MNDRDFQNAAQIRAFGSNPAPKPAARKHQTYLAGLQAYGRYVSGGVSQGAPAEPLVAQAARVAVSA